LFVVQVHVPVHGWGGVPTRHSPLDGLLGEPLLDDELRGELDDWPQSVLAVWPTNAGGLDGSGQSHPGTSGQAWTFLHRRAISLPHKFLR
jgi:hypothetical protein